MYSNEWDMVVPDLFLVSVLTDPDQICLVQSPNEPALPDLSQIWSTPPLSSDWIVISNTNISQSTRSSETPATPDLLNSQMSTDAPTHTACPAVPA
ncbi:uncharacterized protein UBRO_20182 [Ustilago bromivora]|uniref:Uncharacterized protein n=1 Tax=Ustilago bromivora TaxID=307758 RepID=A0A1K0HBL6_9BASI|nr:uncharacterized protein UBRO_20182 [Ustilago bromivora]